MNVKFTTLELDFANHLYVVYIEQCNECGAYYNANNNDVNEDGICCMCEDD